MKALVILALLVVTFMAGCKKDSGNSFTPDCSGGTKSWLVDVKPVMDNYCTSCHSGYSSYSGVYSSRSSIRSEIASGSMPEGTTLSTDQKNIIVCWIDNGAPNN